MGCHCLQAGLSTESLSLGKRVTNVFMYIKETVIRDDLIDGFAIQVFFFNLCMATLDLHCCAQTYSSCGEQGYSLLGVLEFLIVMVYLVAEFWL